jgi:hypothetical protein
VREPVWTVGERRAPRWLVLVLVAAILGAVGVAGWHRLTRPLRSVSLAFAMPSKPARLELVRSIRKHRCHNLHFGDGIVVHAAADRVVRLYYGDALLMAECRPGHASAHCAADDYGRQLRWTFSRRGQPLAKGRPWAAGVYTWVTLPPDAPPSDGRLDRDLDRYLGHDVVPYQLGDVPFRW